MSKIERKAIDKMKHLDETPLIVRLRRAEIQRDPDQPRKSRDPEKLKGLAQTMLVKQLQPILVRQVDSKPNEPQYMIVFGEGRWLAAGINEETTGEEQYLDSILVDETNAGAIRSMQLIENLQREDMNELDVANGYRELIDLGFCKTAKEVAEKMGVSGATVSVFLKVLDAPEPYKQLVKNGMAKIDTVRTLMMLAEINQERADALVQDANDSGVLKRSSVRDAYAEEKARVENAAAVAEAGSAAAQQQAPAATLEPAAPQGTPVAVGTGAEQSEVDVQPGAPADAMKEPQQSAVEAESEDAEGADLRKVEKASETAPKAPQQPAPPTTKLSPAPAPVVTPAPVAPAAQPRNDAAPAAAADSLLVAAGKFDVLVSIRSGTPDEERFISLDVEYGNARLAGHIVHREPSRAWVQFGTDPYHEQLHAFSCGDLEIVKVVQRG